MINLGFVKKLFVELADVGTPDDSGIRKPAGSKVRAAAKAGLEEIGYQELAPAMVSFSEQGIFYQEVIKAAVKKGVLVYYFDKSINDPTSKDGMSTRNSHMTAQYNEHGKGTTNVLLIGGQDHFVDKEGDHSLNNIPGIELFDFSKTDWSLSK